MDYAGKTKECLKDINEGLKELLHNISDRRIKLVEDHVLQDSDIVNKISDSLEKIQSLFDFHYLKINPSLIKKREKEGFEEQKEEESRKPGSDIIEEDKMETESIPEESEFGNLISPLECISELSKINKTNSIMKDEEEPELDHSSDTIDLMKEFLKRVSLSKSLNIFKEKKYLEDEVKKQDLLFAKLKHLSLTQLKKS
jgi:hypothetical protein